MQATCHEEGLFLAGKFRATRNDTPDAYDAKQGYVFMGLMQAVTTMRERLSRQAPQPSVPCAIVIPTTLERFMHLDRLNNYSRFHATEHLG